MSIFPIEPAKHYSTLFNDYSPWFFGRAVWLFQSSECL